MATQANWRQLAEDKRKRRDDLLPTQWILSNPPPTSLLDVTHIPEQSKILTEKEVEITNTLVEVLLEKIASKTWSAVEVTTAFAKRAIIAQQLTNCLAEIFVDRALERAAWLDEQFVKTGKTVGPLHGLPISLKDQIDVKGIESTMGYTAWIGNFAEQNSVLADILESQGAVLYVKTNVPQTLMWPETYNHMFGRTANPFNRTLTSGGSSGGEGALVALRGSPLGVGSDIGGSIRIPSAYNGLYGLRPSYNRMPYAGCVNSLDGQEAMPSVLGPMTTSIEGIKRFMKVVLDAQPWNRDPMVLRMPWNERAYTLAEHGNGGQLCFGILWHDGVVHPHPPVTRALEIVKAALLAKGHRVINWQPDKLFEIGEAASRIYNADGGEDFLASTAPTGEPVIKTMIPQPGEHPTWPKPSNMVEIQNWGSGGKRYLTTYDLWQLHKERRELRREYLEYWQASASETGTGRPIDAIIAPAAPFAAPPHGMSKYSQYTVIWNLLDHPALVIPITRVDPQRDIKRTRSEFFGE
ncbi:general amidase [Amanita rubescens]|nr:general amidase [Amanita rubescens]